MISFKGNLPCRVMSKSIGENSDLWEIEVQGRRGFAPKKMLMEQKILIKAADLIKVEDEPTVEEQTVEKQTVEKQTVESQTVEEQTVEYASDQVEEEFSPEGRDDLTPVNDSEDSSKNEEQISVEESMPAANEPLITKQNDVFSGSYEHEDNKLNENENVRLEIVGFEKKELELLKNISDIESDINISLLNSAESDFNLKTDSEKNDIHLRHQIYDEDSTGNTQIVTNNTESAIYTFGEIEHNDVFSQTREYALLESNRDDVLNSGEEKRDIIETQDITNAPEISGNPLEVQISTPSIENGQMEVIDKTNENDSNNLNHIQSKGEKYKSSSKENQQDVYDLDRNEIISESELLQELLPEIVENTEESHLDHQDANKISQHEIIEREIIQESLLEMPENTKELHSKTNHDGHLESLENLENLGGETEIEIENESNWAEQIYIKLQSGYNSLKQLFDYHSSGRGYKTHETKYQDMNENGYCKEIQGHPFAQETQCPDGLSERNEMLYSEYLNEFLAKVLAMTDLVILLTLTASAILIFIFGHYCLTNRNKEIMLLSKLNALERKLLASQKECSLAKMERNEIQKKLNTIANKSFGANDMVKQHEKEKNELCEQISALESELEAAAEAGLELNKMVAELLSNQSGSESIFNSVQELQHQLNEQEAATVYINNLLAEKSRENSELQIILTDTNKQFGAEIQELLNENKKIKSDKETVEAHLKEVEENIVALESRFQQENEVKINEISHLKDECILMKTKYDEVYFKWQALKDALEKLEGLNESDGMNEKDVIKIIEITEANAKYLAKVKESESLRDQIETEVENNKRSQELLNEMNSEMNRLREVFNKSEKEKLEAQTRLEVLSTYFKEKESQLER